MADWPVFGSTPWSSPLKAYVDDADDAAVTEATAAAAAAAAAADAVTLATAEDYADAGDATTLAAAVAADQDVIELLPKKFSPLTYGATGVAGNDATTALHSAATDAAVNGGVIDLRHPFVTKPVWDLSDSLTIPVLVDVIGDGGNFIGDSGSIIRCTTANSRIVYSGRGGMSRGFTVDGNGTGHPDGILILSSASPVVVGRAFSQICVLDGAGDGWLIQSGQNNHFTNCHGIGNAGSNWILDKGAGGNKFDRCGGSGHGEYGLVIRQTAGGVSPYPTAPAHNQFDHCIWECQNTNVVGVVLITASGVNSFYSCGFAGNVSGIISGGSVIDVDASAGALDVQFHSPFITGKASTTTYNGIRTEGLATVTLTGRRTFYFFNNAHLSDSNLSTIHDYGEAFYSTVTNDWAEGTAGDLTSYLTPHTTHHQWSMPDAFTTAWSVKRKADDGIRAYMNYNGELVWTGDGSGFTNKGKFGYISADDGVQFSGSGLRIAAGFARTINVEAETSGAVTIDAKTTSHSILELVGNATSVTVSNPVSGRRLDITVRQDATGGRTVTWGSGFNFTSGSAPGVTTANTEYTVSFYYDSVVSKWKEMGRSTGVPKS